MAKSIGKPFFSPLISETCQEASIPNVLNSPEFEQISASWPFSATPSQELFARFPESPWFDFFTWLS